MGRYINNALMSNENIIYEAHLSPWAMFPLIATGLLLLLLFGVAGVIFNGGLVWMLPVFLAGLIVWGVAFVRYKTTEIAVTNKRIIVKLGLIARNTVEMNLAKIETIQVNQSLLGRIFDFGSLVISGGGNPQEPIVGIANPMAFRREFMEAQDEAMAKR